jgi:hypothetical protein
MYVNAKMLPAVTVPGIREGRMRERSEGGNSIMMYLIHCKNLCKCYNVPTPCTKKKKKKEDTELKLALLCPVFLSLSTFPFA